MTDVVLAYDIGGTKTAVAVLTRAGEVLRQSAAPTRAGEGPDAVMQTVAELATAVMLTDSTERLCGVGIGTAGVVDVQAGTIVSSTDTFANWPGTDVSGRVREVLGAALSGGAPIAVQNDVDAHAAGEFRHGAAAGARSALVVGVGTGVGSGLLISGEQVRGAHHVAGEIAHMPVPGADHLLCACGRAGHLEAIGSGIGLYNHYISLGGDTALADTRAIAARAADGDDLALRAIADSATAVGLAIAGAATLFDPEIVVITGGVPDIGDAWWEPMLDAYRATVIDVLVQMPIVPGTLGHDAPLRGAASAAWDLVPAAS